MRGDVGEQEPLISNEWSADRIGGIAKYTEDVMPGQPRASKPTGHRAPFRFGYCRRLIRRRGGIA